MIPNFPRFEVCTWTARSLMEATGVFQKNIYTWLGRGGDGAREQGHQSVQVSPGLKLAITSEESKSTL